VPTAAGADNAAVSPSTTGGFTAASVATFRALAAGAAELVAAVRASERAFADAMRHWEELETPGTGPAATFAASLPPLPEAAGARTGEVGADGGAREGSGGGGEQSGGGGDDEDEGLRWLDEAAALAVPDALAASAM